jgi:hypothetical protein
MLETLAYHFFILAYFGAGAAVVAEFISSPEAELHANEMASHH